MMLRQFPCWSGTLLMWLGAVALPLLFTANSSAQDPPQPQAIIRLLETRAEQQPGNASCWRMLGKAYARAGDHGKAISALQKSVELDPQSAAAHCDLGASLLQFGQLHEAAYHFARTVSLAPESEYANLARQHLPHLPALPEGSASGTAIEPASFEVDRIERSDRFPDTSIDSPATDTTPDLKRFSLAIETGALHNTNVTLTPTSRGLSAAEASSYQGILNLDSEFLLFDGEFWRAGPSFNGYFNVNEGPFADLNLQSYQPGFFAERSLYGDTTILVPRVHYTYTLDEFSGATFANRHAINTSVSSLWDAGGTSKVYWTIDHTNFADDGLDPAISSRDGWTNSMGANHLWLPEATWLDAFLVGAEVQLADAVGADFAYRGVSLYSEAEVPLTMSLSMILEGGWGYRDYYRFESTPSRNENIWSAGVRMRQMLADRWSVTGVFRFDDFDSANEEFAAQRILTGIVTVVEF